MNRTKKGNVTSDARKKYGSSGKGKPKPYPVFDHKSAMSALKLRHNSSRMSASAVISKVRRWANAHGDKAVLAACDAAAARDRE